MHKSVLRVGLLLLVLGVAALSASRTPLNTCMQDCDAWYGGCLAACEAAGYPEGCMEQCEQTNERCNLHSEWCQPPTQWCTLYSCDLQVSGGSVTGVNCVCTAYSKRLENHSK